MKCDCQPVGIRVTPPLKMTQTLKSYLFNWWKVSERLNLMQPQGVSVFRLSGATVGKRR